MNQILIVEDEPTLCDAYVFILKNLHSKKRISAFNSYIAHTFQSTIETIGKLIKSKQNLHLCILDFSLKANGKVDNENGMSVGLLLRKHFPECKIILITSISDKYLFHTIINNLRPSGFLVKSETSFSSIEKDICSIIEGKMIYSKSINDFVKKGVSTNARLSNKDLKIVHLMSQGKSLPEIAKIVNLSLSGLEYRKRKIAEKLGASSSNIQDILSLAEQELNIL